MSTALAYPSPAPARRKTADARVMAQILVHVKRCDRALNELGAAQDDIRKLLRIRLADQEGLDRITDLSGGTGTIASMLNDLGIQIVERKARRGAL